MKATVRCGLPYTMVPFAMVLLFFGAAGSHFWIAMYGLATAVFVGVSVPVSMSISSGVLSVRFYVPEAWLPAQRSLMVTSRTLSRVLKKSV